MLTRFGAAAPCGLLWAVLGCLLMCSHASALTVEVRSHRGSPTLFVDGRPTSPLMFFGHAGSATFDTQARFAHRAGIHIHSYVTYPPWPEPGQAHDFSRQDAQVDAALKADPDALLLPRTEIYPPKSWYQAHPDEQMRDDAGRADDWSMASEVWRGEVKEHFRAFVRHLEEKYGDHILGYHLNYNEWFYKNAGGPQFSDFSPPFRAGFSRWLRQRYGSTEALRRAWNDPTADLEGIRLPARDELLHTDLGFFRNPRTERKVIDWFEYKQVAMAEVIEMLARVIKEETQRRKLVGVFYGYTFEMSHIPLGPQDSGHLALARVLRCPDVDLLAAPISYFDLDRRPGGTGSFMCPVDSIRTAGKLWLNEDDTRTYLSRPEDGLGRAATLRETQWIHRRNFAQLFPRRLATWYMDLPATGWLDAQEIWESIAPMQRLYTAHLDEPARWAPEVAVFIDEESPFYTRCSNALHRPLLTWMRPQLNRMGAPFRVHLLSDLAEGKVPRAKAYVFLNCFHLSKAQRKAVASATRGRTAVWLYGGGFVGDETLDSNLAQAVGMRVARGEPQPGLVTPQAGTSPLAAGLDAPFGTATVLDPTWEVAEKGVEVIGRYANGGVAAAAKRSAGSLRVYIGAVHCPARLLRSILQASGVHVYIDTDDMVLTDGKFLSVTATAPAGVPTEADLNAGTLLVPRGADRPSAKRVAFPRPVDVSDALTGAVIGRGLTRLDVELELGETRLYLLR